MIWLPSPYPLDYQSVWLLESFLQFKSLKIRIFFAFHPTKSFQEEESNMPVLIRQVPLLKTLWTYMDLFHAAKRKFIPWSSLFRLKKIFKNQKFKTFFEKILGLVQHWLIWPQTTQLFKFRILENLSEIQCKLSYLNSDSLNVNNLEFEQFRIRKVFEFEQLNISKVMCIVWETQLTKAF